MRVINFAQGDFMMFGAVRGLLFSWLWDECRLATLSAPMLQHLAGPLLFVVGYVIHQALISR
jgi:branched-chain amino acid transport system permease protein